MKHLVFLMLLLGSLSAFADMGEDRHSTNDGVMCQEELNNKSGDSTDNSSDENSAIQEG